MRNTDNTAIIDKKNYIKKYINLLDLNKKEKVCKILYVHGAKLKKNYNGVYIEYNNLSDDIINSVYEYIMNSVNQNT